MKLRIGLIIGISLFVFTGAFAQGELADDAEIFCGGLLLKMAYQSYKTGIVDLTQGELASRGTVESREKEWKEKNKGKKEWIVQKEWTDQSPTRVSAFTREPFNNKHLAIPVIE